MWQNTAGGMEDYSAYHNICNTTEKKQRRRQRWLVRDPARELARDPAAEDGIAWRGDCVGNGGGMVWDCDLWGHWHRRGQK